MALRQGDSYNLPIKILIDNVILDMGLVDIVEFMFGDIRKVYGGTSTDGVEGQIYYNSVTKHLCIHNGTYQSADGDPTAIAGLTGTTGLLRKTAADTWTLDEPVQIKR